jgi:pyruvate/2-oxoglutarate dehydrogenase complex dihydrolipoamide dehydrogenase (E3) component
MVEQLNVAFDFEYDDHEDSYMATFRLFCEHLMLAELILYQPEMFKKQDYQDLAAQRIPGLIFCHMNGGHVGHVRMYWQDAGKTIRCEVSKFEEGGDAKTNIYFPGALMVGPLNELAARFD